MENAMILLYDLCRLCLDEPGTDNIFEPVDWSQDILTHTGLRLSAADKMPQTICSSCRDIINCVKLLKEVALENHKRLLAISDSNINAKEVFVNASTSHLVFVGSNDDENENKEPAEITSTRVSKKASSKHRIMFEDDNTVSERKAEKHGMKRKSSFKPESSAPKLAVRKDLFDSSTTVTSSTVSSKPRSTADPSPRKDPDKKSTHVSTSKSQTPTTSGSHKNVKMEFEYDCETCHRKYATPKKLYLHQLSHNKKFTCPIDVCEKKFATKGDLQKHVRSHTGEKPFKCDLCDQSFTQNVSLKSHRVNIHE